MRLDGVERSASRVLEANDKFMTPAVRTARRTTFGLEDTVNEQDYLIPGDRMVVEENIQMLKNAWEFVLGHDEKAGQLIGLSFEEIRLLRTMDERHLARAADCTFPLFKFGVEDDALADLMKPVTLGSSTLGLTNAAASSAIARGNQVFALHRWGAVKESREHAQCTLGLTDSMVRILLSATLADIQNLCSRGVQLVKMGVRSKYLFHAGTNLKLNRQQRTVLAVCTSSTPM